MGCCLISRNELVLKSEECNRASTVNKSSRRLDDLSADDIELAANTESLLLSCILGIFGKTQLYNASHFVAGTFWTTPPLSTPFNCMHCLGEMGNASENAFSSDDRSSSRFNEWNEFAK